MKRRLMTLPKAIKKPKLQLPDNATIGELYEPAMSMKTRLEAKEYFKLLVQRNMRSSTNKLEEAREIERANLGYFAGYYDTETRKRVERLFRCAHPFFGLAKFHTPTAEDAFALGKRLGIKWREKHEK